MTLKSDRMLEALEKLEVIRDELKHDWADPNSHLYLAIESLKDVLARQLLTERRRDRAAAGVVTAQFTSATIGPLATTIKGYNDEPPERSTLGHTGHPPADRGASEAGCYG